MVQHPKVNEGGESPPLSQRGQRKEELCESRRKESSRTGHHVRNSDLVLCDMLDGVTQQKDENGSNSLSSLPFLSDFLVELLIGGTEP